MAYISNFRRSVASDTKQKGGKGSKGGWWDEYKLPQDPKPPAPFIIIDGNYVDPEAKSVELGPNGHPIPVTNFYYKGRRHRRKGFAGGKETFAETTCSKGYDPFNPQPCAGCMAMESGDKNTTLSDFFTFSIFHLSFYHGHPLTNKDGSFRVKDDGSPVMGYEECSGRDCNFCRVLSGKPPVGPNFPNYDPKSISTVFGRRRYLKMGKGHLSNLSGWDTAVSSLCGTCKATMQTEGFSCPTCDSILIDMEKDNRTTEQIVAAASNPIHCPQCNKAVMVKEASFCPVCDSAGRPWVENKLTDVVLFGSRQGEGTNSTLMLKQFLTIEEFEQQIKGLQQTLNGMPLRQYIAENATPYDFAEVLKPMSLEEQAKKLGVQVGAPAGSGHVPYGNGPMVPPPSALPRPNFAK